MKKKRENNLLTKSILLFLLIIFCLTGCGSIPDGEYTASVILTGGSGKAYIESPCKVSIENGKATADIIWSSPNYDYMVVKGKKYYPVNTEGNSEFIIPVELEKDMAVQADTTAMSRAHLIDYNIRISMSETAEGEIKDEVEVFAASDMKPLEIPGISYIGTDENEYAKCFKIHRYEGGYDLISVEDGRNYFVVPEGADEIQNLPKDTTIIKRPLSKIYLASSAAMCSFDAIGAVKDIALSGTERDDWYIDSAKKAMDEGSLLYGGKFSAPDYEKILSMEVDLAVENTMILHAPKVREKLESLGIPVFIDRSSYEEEPLGRCEWIRVYGLLTGREDEAYKVFSQQRDLVSDLDLESISGKKVAVFSVNTNHQIVTRRENDYFAKMIEMAGGEYLAPKDSTEDMSSQTTISLEAFYDYAGDADILIYNGAIYDPPGSIQELYRMDDTFSRMSACKNGEIWYTDKSMFQFADKTGTIIQNLNRVIAKGESETEFFHRLTD